MKFRFIFCFFTLLFLLTGCRGPSKSADSSTAMPLPSASAMPSQTPAAASPTGGDTPLTPTPSVSILPSSTPSAAEPSSPTPSASHDALPSAKPAPSEDVGATLDEIIKELNDLDKLYSQMDNLSESDMN